MVSTDSDKMGLKKCQIRRGGSLSPFSEEETPSPLETSQEIKPTEKQVRERPSLPLHPRKGKRGESGV